MLRELINNFLESISPILVLLVFVLFRNQWKSFGYMRVLFLYYLGSSITLAIATYLAYLNTSNIFWYNLQGFLTLLTLSIFYSRILQTSLYRQLILNLSTIGLIAYILILAFFDDRITFNSAGYAIGSFLIIIYSLIFLREVFSIANENPLHMDVTVWIVSAFLTYFLSSFLIQISYKNVTKFLLSSFTKDPKDSWVWPINNVLYLLTNLFVAINVIRFCNRVKTNKTLKK